jgi:hypothetical protein
LTVNTRVAKAGPATGRTEGNVDFIYPHVKFTDSPEETAEYTVVSPDHQLVVRFSDAGDSGAFVINKGGEVVGMVLGGTYGLPNVLEGFESWGGIYTSYITPMPSVRETVERWLGDFDIVVDL